MFLTLDIGNTNIKAALFSTRKEKRLVKQQDTLFEFKSFGKISNLKKYLMSIDFSEAAISSVVPEKTKKISALLESKFKVTPVVISKDLTFNLKIKYKTPETLGIDRLCSAEGAYAIFRNSAGYKYYNSKTFLLAIDFGTATTINVVGYRGAFLGGVIAPGIKMMSNALNKNTAQLPEIALSNYKGVIGNDTKSSIASGILNSTLGLIEKTVSMLKKEYSAEQIRIFITGGNAELILPYIKLNFKYEPALVLKGIKAIYTKNRQ